MSTPALNPLVTKVRTMHPGAYDDMDDATLTKRVLAKYPQYSDLAVPGPTSAAKPNVNMQEMPGTASLSLPAHGAGSLGPGQPEATPGMGAAGIAGLGLGAAAATAPAVIPPIAAAGTKLIKAHPVASMMAIEAAKKIPVIGKYASGIPSWLPLLAGGKPAAPEAEAAEEAPIAAPPTEAPPVSIPRATTPLSETAAYSTGPRPVIARPGPVPGSPEDIAETKGIQEQIRNAAEQEGRTINSQNKREWFARNQPGKTKGELTGTPEKPVKFTKTPGIAVPANPNEDLTPILKKSLEQARKKKPE